MSTLFAALGKKDVADNYLVVVFMLTLCPRLVFGVRRLLSMCLFIKKFDLTTSAKMPFSILHNFNPYGKIISSNYHKGVTR